VNRNKVNYFNHKQKLKLNVDYSELTQDQADRLDKALDKAFNLLREQDERERISPTNQTPRPNDNRMDRAKGIYVASAIFLVLPEA